MRKKILSVLVSALLLCAFLLPQTVTAAQPYVCGWFDTASVLKKCNVSESIHFQGTLSIPSNSWLAGVLSVAGCDNNKNVDGKVYQNGVSLQYGNSVGWWPQAYRINADGTKSTLHHEIVNNVGTKDTYRYYVRMQLYSDRLHQRLYIYDTSTDYTNDNYRYKDFTYPCALTDWFLVGDQTHSGDNFQHYQFGVESYSAISCAWQILNEKIGHDCPTPGYQPAKAKRGSTNLITWNGDWMGGVGGLDYGGAQKYSSSNDTVTWKRTGTTQTDNQVLWSGSGSVSDSVDGPYELYDRVQPFNFIVTSRTSTSISLSWDKGADAEKTRIRYSTNDYPDSPTSGTNAYWGTGESCTVSNLSPDTGYYFSAWGYDEDTSQYSKGYSFVRTSTLSEGSSSTFTGSASDGDLITDFYASWSEVHDLSSADDKQDTWRFAELGVWEAGSEYYIQRAYIYFDTSSIPDDVTITSASLKLYSYFISDNKDFYVTVQSGMPTCPHDPLRYSDFDQSYYSGNGGSIYGGDISSGYNSIGLSELGWINKTGTTKFCLRESHDIDDVAPTDDYHWAFRTHEKGSDYAPKLEVTWD